jgi:NAD(P)H-quinone oxidoreductase subunit 5
MWNLLPILVLAIPATYVVGAALPVRASSGVGLAAMGLAAATALGWAASGDQVGVARVDGLTVAMLGLVTLVGFVLVRFSGPYLDGDPGRRGDFRAMLATLAGVTVLVGTDHLGVALAAWTGTSLALHRLLTHFRERPAARLAAREKFVASRVAEALLLGAVVLIGREVGSLSISELERHVGDAATLSPALRLAAVLIVGCVALKSAALPFHGWLTHVMEAPTPVSALLHAGVVNLGAFVLLRLAPLLAHAPEAQLALVAIGGSTAVLAGLILPTRVSVKLQLAWSTIAQMGFVLLECGLGAYDLALLHLLAHSLYEAHAFLTAGSTVERWLALQLASPKPAVGAAAFLAGGATSAIAAAGLALAVGLADPPSIALAGVTGLAVAPLLLEVRSRPAAGLAALGVIALYLAWHPVMGALLDAPTDVGPWGPRLALVAALFSASVALQAALRSDPELARRAHPVLFAGLWLDQPVTRLVSRCWPLPRPMES